MAGLDVAASAMGVASLGIQVCQGLITYYDAWKGYGKDIDDTHASIADLSKTLTLLKGLLASEILPAEPRDRVVTCLHTCEEAVMKLQAKLQKLRSYDDLDGFRRKTWAELQKLSYPFRSGTLIKLKDITNDVLERLKFALSILHLDLSTVSQATLTDLEADVRDTISGLRKVEGGMTQLSIQNATLLTAQEGVKKSLSHLASQSDTFLVARNHEQFQKTIAWLSPPDPWTNHETARRHHELGTGSWLLRSNEYCTWLNSIGHLWLHGKAGCGKTILCSTAIEDVHARCNNRANVAYAIFYFSFSDGRKQSLRPLLLSLIAQLGQKEPSRERLRLLYETSNRAAPGLEELEKILFSCLTDHDEVFILLDALDECPEHEDTRETMLVCLRRLTAQARNVRVLATSRPISEVKNHMEAMNVVSIAIDSRTVDQDITKYVSSEMTRDRKLQRFDEPLKQLIRDTLTQKANGMFRWVDCQMRELKKLKSTRRRYLEQTLHELPPTLDATYERMLIAIDDKYRTEAITALGWLACAMRPLSLRELSEATNIDITGDGGVDVTDKGSVEDLLEILSDLVVIDGHGEDGGHRNQTSSEGYRLQRPSSTKVRSSGPPPDQRFKKDITKSVVRFAHFSVKEFLSSTRILHTEARDYFLEDHRTHRFLADSCLIYLQFCSSSSRAYHKNASSRFPLLHYASNNWSRHSIITDPIIPSREKSFLNSRKCRRLLCLDPGSLSMLRAKKCALATSDDNVGFHWACIFGLRVVACEFLQDGADINSFAQGRTALQTACLMGHEKLAKLLIERGADVSASGGNDFNPLHAACWSHSVGADLVEMLIDHGADVNATSAGEFGAAIHIAAASNKLAIVEVLIRRGADVNALAKAYDTVLIQAARGGNLALAELLLRHGADVNARGTYSITPLVASISYGHPEIVKLLARYGANVNLKGSYTRTPFQQAVDFGQIETVQILLKHGADPHEGRDDGRGALDLALRRRREDIAELLIASGAQVSEVTSLERLAVSQDVPSKLG